MAEIFVGEVAVGVVPDLRGFNDKMRRELVPAAERIGQEMGQRMGKAISASLGIGPAVSDSARRGEADIARAGDRTATTFARSFKTRLAAETRGTEINVGVNVDTSKARAELALLKRDATGSGSSGGRGGRGIIGDLGGLFSGGSNATRGLDSVTKSLGNVSSGFAGVVAAGVALSPVLVTVGAGFGGLALAATDVIAPILKAGTATNEQRLALESLDPAQKAAYDSLNVLKTEFHAFSAALEPEVLAIFTKGLGIASTVMSGLEPIAKETGKALGDVLGMVDAEFKSGTWQEFFGFMAKNAGPDTRLLGKLLVDLLHDLPPLLEQMQPLAEALINVSDAALKVVGWLGKLHLLMPVLGAAIGFLVGGPMGALIGAAAGSGFALAGLGGHTEKLTGQIQVAGQNVREVTPAVARFGTSAGGASGHVKDLAGHVSGLHDTTRAASPAMQQISADTFVMGQQAKFANDKVTQLNTAWDAFLGKSTSLETAYLGIQGTLKTLTDQANAAGASFTGVNEKSAALQQTFEGSLVPSVQNVIDNMRTAHAATRDLAAVVATQLKPAVDKGALSNDAFRQQIYDMATEAGYHGVNSVKALRDWFNHNATSADVAKGKVDKYSQSLAMIPDNVNSHVVMTGNGQYVISQRMTSATNPYPGGISGRAATGMYINMGTGPTADDVLIRASRGELIVPTNIVNAGYVDHLRGLIPGFAGGGLLPGQWDMSGWKLTPKFTGEMFSRFLHAMTGSMVLNMRQSMKQMEDAVIGTPVRNVGSGIARWAPTVRQALGMEGLNPYLQLRVLYQIQTESGGNPNAINLTDINAQHGDPSRGLLQVIGATFRAYHWPGTSTNIYDPLANIASALNYARHTYGPSLMSGGMGLGSGHGYDQGGWLPTGVTLAHNLTGSPELILNRSQLADYAASMIRSRGGPEQPTYVAHFDSLTGDAIESHVRTAFQAMSLNQGHLNRQGRRS